MINPWRNHYCTSFCAALVLLLSACSSTPTATTDHDPSFDFTKVRDIAILPVNRQVMRALALSDMQASRIAASLETELQRRGYTIVDSWETADVWLTWHLVTQERTQVRTYNTVSARYSRCWNCPPTRDTNVQVQQYTQGTIIVDMIDPARQVSVWRSIVDKPRNAQREDQLAQGREERARALFADFPP